MSKGKTNRRSQRTQRKPNGYSSEIIGAAFEVHTQLGPGLLESVYKKSTCTEGLFESLEICTQIEVPVLYKGLHLAQDFV